MGRNKRHGTDSVDRSQDNHLEKCSNPECQNVINPSCFNKLSVTFAEDEWEGPAFCGKWCFNSHKKC